MRILFCSPTPLDPRLGASKVYIEAAEGFRRLGWDVTVVGPAEVASGHPPGDLFAQPARLRNYLQKYAAEYDVVEYEHHALPFPRTDFPPGPLFVARSVLLAHTQATAQIPTLPTVQARVGRLLKGWARRRWWRRILRHADLTLQAADLINVSNGPDRDLLIRHGHPAEKVAVFPFGLFPERLVHFPPPGDPPVDPVIAFVGSFDPRKGLREFPRIVGWIVVRHPAARFRLVGTAGIIPTADGVRSFFPRSLRPRLEIVPRFDPADLPGLLSGCSAGVFPSHCEGFPFGVLEMLAAGLPVVAYDAPGPPEMLPPDWLVPKGDGVALSGQVADLLADPDSLGAARRLARARAREFNWEHVVARTADDYSKRLSRRAEVPRWRFSLTT